MSDPDIYCEKCSKNGFHFSKIVFRSVLGKKIKYEKKCLNCGFKKLVD